ncbi:MAG: hypothetical protein CL613_06390 [Aquimarina sp.]|nr:hypothetical protein [Aquimarina sp.]
MDIVDKTIVQDSEDKENMTNNTKPRIKRTPGIMKLSFVLSFWLGSDMVNSLSLNLVFISDYFISQYK